jgi:dCMP deaminase
MADWDLRFMELAKHIATWSKDKSRQTGCVIVGPAREIRSMGYNGFPRGVFDENTLRHERPEKYLWTEHAERNAIYNAARIGVSVEGCTAYIPWYPCMDCARAIIQSGIATLVAYRPEFDDPKWGHEFKKVFVMLEEAKVETRWLEGSIGNAK